MRGWSHVTTESVFPRSTRAKRCGWSASTGLSTRPSGPRSSRLRASWGARPRRSGSGSGRPSAIPGLRGGLTTAERQRTKELEREVRELKRINEILRKASAYFAQAGARPPTEVMVQFIDDHRDAYGVESICTVVPIAPSTYFWHKARHADPTRRSARVQRDDEWRREIQRVWDDNQQVYGPRKVWR